MTIALVVGGGAPNLTLMAGAIAALDEAGVKFDVVSTAGAGMLIGLLYAAPKGISRSEALKNLVNSGVHDAIYRLLPVNFKVFHKPGVLAQAYTRFWQSMAGQQAELWQRLMGSSTPDTQRLVNDWTALMLACACPSDLGPASLGLCQPAPLIDEMVDFARLKDFAGEFYMSAYCIEAGRMEIFPKEQVDIRHFQAAMAFPMIYAPFKLDGKTYLEGAAQDTLNFKGLYEHRAGQPHIDTIVVFDVLGMKKLIAEPRNLYDAWVKSIIVPLVAIAEDDLKLFREVHKKKLRPEPKLLSVGFEDHIPSDHWPNVLDWSYSNLELLYDVGYRAGKDFFEEHRADLVGPRSRSQPSF